MSTIPAMVGALLSVQSALAEGYSTDIELLQPTFSVGSIPGIDSPDMGEANRWRVGLLTQFEQDPLVLFDSGYELGAIVEDRIAMQAGLNYTIARRAAVQILAPVYVNNGTQTPNFAASGAGFGDLALSARFQALKLGPLSAGVRASFTAPTGRKDAYMGEASLRTGGALLAKLDLGPVEFLSDAGAMARSRLETEEDVTFSSELVINSGIRVEPVQEHLWLFGGALTRGGLANLWQPESGENPVEAIAGAQLKVGRDWQFDAGVGRGLTDGYGTTEQRVFFGATWQQGPRPEQERGVGVVVPPEPPPPPVSVYQPPEPIEDFDGPAALDVFKEQIVIREPIQFEFNTANILPESIPTLQAVAHLLQTHPEIGQLIVEGHASEEGSFEYNYRLSLMRSIAVWEALIAEGVHPRRLGTRGMGEVVGTTSGDNEAQLARERRVEFHIVQWFDELGDPSLDPEIQYPITGASGAFSLPQPEQLTPVEPEPDRFDPDLYRDDEDLDLDLFQDGEGSGAGE